MARLSDPESVLQKLTGLGGHIDEFYETAQLAKQIKDRLVQARDAALDQEKQFETRNAEMENLKTGYEKNLLILGELIRSSQEELGSMLTALGYERNAFQQTAGELAAEKKAFQKQCWDAENSFFATAKEVTDRMAWLEKEQDMALAENRFLILRELDEFRVNAKKEAESLRFVSAQAQEETGYLADQTELWRQNAEKRLFRQLRSFDALRTLYEKAVQELAVTGRKYETERAGLLEAFRTEKHAVREVVEKLICERQIFRDDLLLLEKEKAAILKEITGQMAWLSEQSAVFFREMQYRMAQHLDEDRNLLLTDRERLTQFTQEMREEILLHCAELESFEKRTKIRIRQRIGEFDNIRFEYANLFEKVRGISAYCETELVRVITDYGFEKEEVKKFAMQLSGEHQETIHRHRQMQKENQEILRAITGQIAYAEQAVQENLAQIRLRAVQEMEEHRIHIQNAWEELHSFSNELREEISYLEEGVEKFTNRRAFEIARMAHALKMQAEHFRKSGIEKIEQHLARETVQLQERFAQEFQNLRTGFEEEKTRLGNLIEQRMAHEFSQLSDIKEKIRHQTQSLGQIWEQWSAFCREADAGLAGLRELICNSDREFLQIRTDFAYEKMQIREQFEKLERKHAQMREQQNKSEQFLREYLLEITAHTGYEFSELQKKFQENACRIAHQMAEHRQMIEQEKAGFSLLSDQIQEENLHLADEMERFKNETLAHLNHRYRELGHRQEKFRQSLSEECRTLFSEESRHLRNTAESERKEIFLALEREKSRLDESLRLLEADKEQFQAHIARLKEIFEKADAFEEKSRNTIRHLTEIRDHAEEELERIISAFGMEKEQVHQALERIAHERSELRTQYQHLSQEAAQNSRNMTEQLMVFRENSGVLLQEIHSRFAQEIEEYRNSAQNDAQGLNLCFSQAQEEVRHLKEELTVFQQRLLADTEQKISILSAQNGEFRQSVAKETDENLNEKLTGFQEKILSDTEQRISVLSAQNEEFRQIFAKETHDKLKEFRHEILSDTDQKISILSGQNEEFRQNFAKETHENLNGKLAEFRHGILSEAEQKISTLSEQYKHLVQNFKTETDENLNEKLTGFQEKILSDTDQKISALSAQNEEFRQIFAKERHDKLKEFRQEILSDTDQKISILSAENEVLRQHLAKEMENCFSPENFRKNAEPLFQEIHRHFTQKMADTEQKISALSAQNQEFRQSFAKETDENLNEKLTDFQEKIFSDTEQKISILSAENEEFRQSFAKETDENLNGKLKEFRHEILSETEQKISALSAQNQEFRQSFAKETDENLNEKLTGFQEKILSETERKISILSAENEVLRQHLAKEMENCFSPENFRKNAEPLFQEIHSHFTQKMADTEQKISALSAQNEEFRQSFAKKTDENLNEKLTDFQEKIFSDTEQKISALSEQHEKFSQHIAKEMEDRFSQIEKQESFGEEKAKMDAALSLLESQQTEIREHQKSFSQKLEGMDGEMRKFVAATRQYSEKEVKRVSGELDIAKKEIGDTKKYLGTFAEQIKEKLKQDSEKQTAQQADFRKKIIAALIARLGEDIRKLQDQDDITLRECTDKINLVQRDFRENTENLEGRITDSLGRMKAEQERVLPVFHKNIGILAERQKNQGEILKELGERIKSIENYLKTRIHK